MNKDEVDKKEQKDQLWIANQLKAAFLGIAELDEETAGIVLKHCSEVCFQTWLSFITKRHGWDPNKSDFNEFLIAVDRTANQFVEGHVNITRKDSIITEEITLGECCCPLIRNRVITPFPNLCCCTRNMLGKVYEIGSKRPVTVNVVESYNRGGNRCLIQIELL